MLDNMLHGVIECICFMCQFIFEQTTYRLFGFQMLIPVTWSSVKKDDSLQ